MLWNHGAGHAAPAVVIERRAVLLRAARAAVVATWIGLDVGMLRRLAERRDDVVHRQDAGDRQRDEDGAERSPGTPGPGSEATSSHAGQIRPVQGARQSTAQTRRSVGPRAVG